MVTEDATTRRPDRARPWLSKLAVFVAGLLLFETLTGLSIYLLPFSVSNQIMVLLHTAGGLLIVPVFFWYQLKHWLFYRRYTMTHVKLTGYVALVVLAACGVSGLVLTWQAGFARQISSLWDTVHVVTTFAVVAFLLPHIALIVLRDRKSRANDAVGPVLVAEKRYIGGMAATAGFFFLGLLGALALYQPVKYNNTFPADYSMPFGPDRPFAPSLATTTTGGALDPQSLSDSKSCGQAGCHEQIYKEWQVSAHRWASMDKGFQAVQTVMAKQNGPESTRYCGGCHDPVSLFSGTKNLFAANLTSLPGYNEGVSCIVCHAIKKTDIKGNANYVIAQPARYMLEGRSGPAVQWASNFLIRAYPRGHNQTFNHRLFKSPEFCAACHKQFIDKEVNKVGWVQLQNQYDNWRKSHWNSPGNPRKTIECRECHMPLQKSVRDTLAALPGDYNRKPYDGYHRSHRFLGSNQFMPGLMKIPGWEEQTALTEQWLKGEYEVPEIADKWHKGAAIPIEIIAPKSAAPGETVNFMVKMGSNKVGHDYPTGPLDIIQSWVEIKATDDAGKLVFASGRLDGRNFIEKGSFIFRAEPVDQYGNLIERHNLWEMVGVRYKRSLFPGFWDQAPYSFACPADTSPRQPLPPRQSFTVPIPKHVTGHIHIAAKLRYRKIGQFLINFLFGEDKHLTTPVTDLSTATATIEVSPQALQVAHR